MSADPPRLLVADLPLLPPLLVHATTTVRDVATAMLRRQTSSALIAETGAIITERDLVRLLAEGASPDTPADTAATPRHTPSTPPPPFWRRSTPWCAPVTGPCS